MKNKVAEFREAFGYSQQTMADQLDVSRQTIISIEKGKYNPSLPLGMRIAELFKVTVEDVFELEAEDRGK